MTPLGLHHQMSSDGHYGPGPWISGGPRADWTPVYYNRADAKGIGFDRMPGGSDAIGQYAPDAAKLFDSPAQDDRYLLWFHHVPWDYRTLSGRSLWDEMVVRYSRGVDEVAAMRRTWAGLQPYVDPERFHQVSEYLSIQENEARWWRDACLAYFQSLSKRPMPAGYASPAHPLDYYEHLRFPYVAGTAR
jgi:alpha-glucuronidase